MLHPTGGTGVMQALAEKKIRGEMAERREGFFRAATVSWVVFASTRPRPDRFTSIDYYAY